MVPRRISGVIGTLLGRRNTGVGRAALAQEVCLFCGASLADDTVYLETRVCPDCRFHYSITARDRIQLVADRKSFREKFRAVISIDPLLFNSRDTYRSDIFNAQLRTGLTEAAIVGQCRIEGIPTVLLALDFSFLGGSMGLVVGEKVALACELAQKKDLPLVALVTSGGARLQEGALSLMQMAKAATAVGALHRKGLPYIAVFANPTTGQAYASFANMADVLLAEPGALMGFAPLRVLQESAGQTLPEDSHTAESHLRNGMLDNIVDREEMRGAIATILRRLVPARTRVRLLVPRERNQRPQGQLGAWEAVQRTRHAQRPTARDYIDRVFREFVEFHGDRLAADDPSVICGVGDLYGASVMVVAQQRTVTPEGESQPPYIGPEGFRKAQRAMNMAAKFRIPVITLIDCAGPALTLEAEEKGLGNALANTIFTMSNLPVPTIAVILGEGGRESALAFSIADRILMLEGAIYTPASPEAAASMLYRDDSRAPDVALSLRLTAQDVKDLNIIDAVVPEPVGGAHEDPEASAYTLERALVRAIARVERYSTKRMLNERHKRFRKKGEYGVYYQQFLTKEAQHIQRVKGTPKPTARPDDTMETEILAFPVLPQDYDVDDEDDNRDGVTPLLTFTSDTNDFPTDVEPTEPSTGLEAELSEEFEPNPLEGQEEPQR